MTKKHNFASPKPRGSAGRRPPEIIPPSPSPQQDNFREQSLDLSEKDWHESEVKKADSRLHLYRQHSLVRGGCGYSRQYVYGVYS